ncbi:MAG: diacylglycerol kinase family lipid kinase [Candidatus Marinimicrobia bacterium]|jgi:YegS/Rv2252/BmrU family lipid kinase|nr:diacylglycerol kinase family lipid kinase [Candidatus Neomarinimicrobiota bacterium]MDP6835978.1 diacylglycerol kinase family lipid kinase [Candidatus Neomarinimicrobiota bacterium]|tara:strand:+ start:6357 stop:7265 length:909 start_codon:yes stop_codon:yes gene_type:complete
MRYLFVLNPLGGRGRALKLMDRLEPVLMERGVDYEICHTEAPEHATEITREKREDYDVVVAFGGDGTMNEVVNGIVGSDTALGMIPLGTGNDFARSCRMPLKFDDAVENLLTGQPKKIDLGVFNGDKYFANVVGVGFDAYAGNESKKIQKLKGTAVYVYAVFKTLRHYDSIPMTIELDDQKIEEPTYLISVGNGWSVGGGLQLTPDAVIDDSTFHVCQISDISSMKVVANFTKLFNGRINDLDEVSLRTSRKVKISSEVPLPIHIDGEIPEREITEIEIEMIPEGLSVVGNWAAQSQGAGVA